MGGNSRPTQKEMKVREDEVKKKDKEEGEREEIKTGTKGGMKATEATLRRCARKECERDEKRVFFEAQTRCKNSRRRQHP